MDPRALPEVALVLPPSRNVETPYNHVAVCVMSGVSDRDVLEHMAVCTKNSLRTVPYHPPLSDHAPCPSIP